MIGPASFIPVKPDPVTKNIPPSDAPPDIFKRRYGLATLSTDVFTIVSVPVIVRLLIIVLPLKVLFPNISWFPYVRTETPLKSSIFLLKKLPVETRFVDRVFPVVIKFDATVLMLVWSVIPVVKRSAANVLPVIFKLLFVVFIRDWKYPLFPDIKIVL